MKYRLVIQSPAQKEIDKHISSGDKVLLKKLFGLLEELELHPRTGTGKPERLKHHVGEVWSRRINEKHRLVYEISEQIITVEIVRVYGHYDDK
jgi:toxin YoeB